MPEHLDEAVNTKELNLASHEITDARLCHAEQLGRLRLSKTALFDQLAQTDHEVRAHAEVLGFVVREPEVTKNVARRASNSHGHSFLLGLASGSHQLGVPSLPQVDISLRCLLRPLGESVQDVDRFSKLCDVEHPILLSRMNSYFDNPWSYCGHRPPVSGGQSLLNPPELKSRLLARISGKRAQIFKRRAEPDKGFVCHSGSMQKFV
jgi:hypothetical protein